MKKKRKIWLKYKKETKPCPYCNKEIPKFNIQCPYCHKYIIQQQEIFNCFVNPVIGKNQT